MTISGILPGRVDLKLVRAFIAVADASSVTKAAARLHISQPPLSRQIHHLEEELGLTLFVRHSHGVTLTEAGARLLEQARAVDRVQREFEAAARREAGHQSRREAIRVGIGWGLWDLVNCLRVEFSARSPQAVFEVIDTPCWYDSDEKLRNGSIDIALARPPFDPAYAVSDPVQVEPIQAVVAEHSPLAAQASVSVRDLSGETLLLWDRNIAPVLYDQILSLYARARVSPPMVPTPGAGPYNHAGILLVASGKGIYLGYGVPGTGNQVPGGVAARPVSDQGATVEVRAVYSKDGVTAAVSQFLDAVRAVSRVAEAQSPPDRAVSAGVRSRR